MHRSAHVLTPRDDKRPPPRPWLGGVSQRIEVCARVSVGRKGDSTRMPLVATLGAVSPPLIRDFSPPPTFGMHGRSVSRRSLLLAAGGVAATALVGASILNPAPAAAWGGYSNGQIPVGELSVVAGHRFRKDAAESMIALRSAYQSALGRALVINDGYRDLAGQQAAWNNYLNGGNLAARPGTSNHGWAIAVDFGGEVYSSSNSAGHQWLQANAGGFGWWWAGRYFSQLENWHWEYKGSYDPPTTNPIVNIGFEDMTFLCMTPINGSNGDAGVYRWIIDPAAGTKRNIDGGEYEYLKAVGYREVAGLQAPITSARYQQIYPAATTP